MSIIRYGRGLQGYFKDHAPDSVNHKGNGIGSYGASSVGGVIGSAFGLPTSDGQFDGAPNEDFNPARMFQSKMFDIEIRQTVPSPGQLGRINHNWNPKKLGEALQDFGQAVLDAANEDLVNTSNVGKNETPVIVLRDCRFEDMAFELNKRGVATLNLTFRARYADDDSFTARKSGVGQEFS
jgi:hypothetical protein